MPRRATATDMLPAPASRALLALGTNLRVARKRRRESLATFAERMQVSVPTLQKMEKGDPTVSVGVYASALWLIGRVQFLATIADPATDETALMLELHKLSGKKSAT